MPQMRRMPAAHSYTSGLSVHAGGHHHAFSAFEPRLSGNFDNHHQHQHYRPTSGTGGGHGGTGSQQGSYEPRHSPIPAEPYSTPGTPKVQGQLLAAELDQYAKAPPHNPGMRQSISGSVSQKTDTSAGRSSRRGLKWLRKQLRASKRSTSAPNLGDAPLRRVPLATNFEEPAEGQDHPASVSSTATTSTTNTNRRSECACSQSAFVISSRCFLTLRVIFAF